LSMSAASALCVDLHDVKMLAAAANHAAAQILPNRQPANAEGANEPGGARATKRETARLSQLARAPVKAERKRVRQTGVPMSRVQRADAPGANDGEEETPCRARGRSLHRVHRTKIPR